MDHTGAILFRLDQLLVMSLKLINTARGISSGNILTAATVEKLQFILSKIGHEFYLQTQHGTD